jgi:hypothetical protein
MVDLPGFWGKPLDFDTIYIILLSEIVDDKM